MLRKLRIGVSLFFFVLFSFYFIDFAGILPHVVQGLTAIQFIPALLAINGLALILIVGSAFLFGRVYCSFLCPMGIFQDVLCRIIPPKKKKYSYRKANTLLRWSVVGLVCVFFCFGFTLVVGIFDPYSAFGRMLVHVFKPVYIAGNNILASVFNHFDNYTFYRVEIVMLQLPALLIGFVTFCLITFLAWRYGRLYCNTICPVGTLIGLINRVSLFKIRINDSCNHCGRCASKCKASCIDSKAATIDYSRCLACFTCLDVCPKKALSFTVGRETTQPKIPPEPADKAKRNFLLTGLATSIALPTLLAQTKTKILPTGKNKTRQLPISPPGAGSAEHLLHHCTSCHLCISKCPSKVLKPAFMEYGLGGMMQPLMYFEKGFCNYDCTLCSSICPNKALLPLSREQKHLTQVGKVVFNQEICVVHTEGTNCGACSEHCPTQAVKMIPYKDGLTIPFIDTEICVGCGGCEFICPVRPYRAIYVEGNSVQQPAKAFVEEKKEEVEITDFGF
jgi:ferredoxin